MRLFYKGAGILFWKQSKGRIYVHLGKRAVKPDFGTWSVPGGGMDDKDKGDYLTCAVRETNEEYFSYKQVLKREKMTGKNYYVYKIPMVMTYVTYFVKIKEIFPKPNHEFSKTAWFDIDLLPIDIHPGVIKSLEYFKKNIAKV